VRRNRPFWSGVLTFGLVSIPVDLYPATRPGGAPLRLLDEDGTPLHRRYYCPEHDADVPQEHLVRGYELDDGRYVTVTDDELAAVDPKKSREIDLRLFAPDDGIDPMFFEHAYFLAPGEDSGKAYRLLASVMERGKRAGIATFVMRDQEYLVAILSDNGLLRAETLRFHDEVRSPKKVGISKARKAPSALVKKFEQAIAELQTKRLPTAELTDEHAERIEDLVQKKHRRGEDLVRSKTPAEKPEGADVIDLMEALKRSLKGARSRPAHKKRGTRSAQTNARTSRARRAR
jgi:DNA end-binding protein Ku